MEGRMNRETEELEIKLFPEEEQQINQQGWCYDKENDIIVLKDQDGFYSVFQNIATKTPDNWVIKFNK